MLNRQRHEVILKNILKDIYSSTDFTAVLGFKGGTCLYVFYNLDRFSVDLDFNLMSSSFDEKKMTEILSKHFQIDEYRNKFFTWFWVGSYEKGQPKIKIEINKRNYPDHYLPLDFYGLTIPTMTPDCMLAHKLCAITDRKVFQPRDLYDVHFMFKRQFEPNEEIIQIRTGKSSQEYFDELIYFIEQKVKPHRILEGLGELLTENQKDRVKNTLITDVLFDLRVRTKKT